MTCYDINMTPPKVLFHSAEHRAATHSKVPESCERDNIKRRKRPQVSQGNTLNSDVRGDKRHRGKEHMRSQRVQDRTHVDGVRPTQPPEPAPSVTHPQAPG